MDIKVLASGSSGNCYLITDNHNHKLLIECGIPWKEILKGIDFDLEHIDGCLVTHEHKDHSKAIKDVAGHSINVYCSKGTAEAANVLDSYRVHPVENGKEFYIGSWKILPLKAEHDAKEPLMFVIISGCNCLLFATDTMFIPYKFKGLTHVMLEVNYDMDILNGNIEEDIIARERKYRLMYSHMNIDTAKKFFKVNEWENLKRIILIHLSRQNSNGKKFIKEIEKITGLPVETA